MTKSQKRHNILNIVDDSGQGSGDKELV